jgi:hypothetical protein
MGSSNSPMFAGESRRATMIATELGSICSANYRFFSAALLRVCFESPPEAASRPGMNRGRKPSINGARRGRVLQRSELKNSRDGIFQQFPKNPDGSQK